MQSQWMSAVFFCGGEAPHAVADQSVQVSAMWKLHEFKGQKYILMPQN